MVITLTVLALTIILFIRGKVRADLVALCGLVVLMVSDVLAPEEALAGFSNPIVIMMVGLFIVGGGILHTGLADMISRKLVQLSGDTPWKVYGMVMLATAGIGGFVSNTGTVALMLPIVVSMALSAKMNPSRLLMPMAFASSMGGMMTLIGTPPNLVISNELVRGGYGELGFFEFSKAGIIVVVVGTVVLWFLSGRFLNRKGDRTGPRRASKSLEELAREYHLYENRFVFSVPAGGGEAPAAEAVGPGRADGSGGQAELPGSKRASSLVGRRIRDLDIAARFGVIVLDITKKLDTRRLFAKTERQTLASPDTVFELGDRIAVSGPEEQVRAFAEEFGLKFVWPRADRATQQPADAAQAAGPFGPAARPFGHAARPFGHAAAQAEGSADQPVHAPMDFEDIGIAEVVVLSNSRLVNKLVRDTGFREGYGINILGIQRNNQYILDHLKDEKILAGDALLVQGEWKNIARLDEQMIGLVVIGQPLQEASKVKLDYKAPLAALIMVGMVMSMVFNLLPAVTAVMLAGILMIFSGCLRNVEAAFQTINWESILLISAMIPMATALEKTGVSAWVAENLASGLGGFGPIYLLGGIYLATSTLTLFINNTATAVLFAPIAMQVATGLGVSPYPFLFAVAIAASMCFASPFSTPPNALVMSAGRYTFMDYVRVGLPLQLLFFVLMTLVLPLIFPF